MDTIEALAALCRGILCFGICVSVVIKVIEPGARCQVPGDRCRRRSGRRRLPRLSALAHGQMLHCYTRDMPTHSPVYRAGMIPPIWSSSALTSPPAQPGPPSPNAAAVRRSTELSEHHSHPEDI